MQYNIIAVGADSNLYIANADWETHLILCYSLPGRTRAAGIFECAMEEIEKISLLFFPGIVPQEHFAY